MDGMNSTAQPWPVTPEAQAAAAAAGAHDHSGHDHSAHAAGGDAMAGMDHGKFMASVGRRPDGSYYYPHGAFTGHVVPGAFFLAWGLWWTLATYAHYMKSLARRRPFATRGWQLVPWGPARLRRLPLEPCVKLLLPLCGILGELWLGHESYRPLFAPDGKFAVNSLNDWQHSTMYAAFMASGVVDLLGFYLGAPPCTELAFLGLAFLSEGLLLVFHLKGPTVEILVHLILVLQVFATVVAILAELAVPSSILAASARPWLTMVQGAWWIQTAYIMYTSAPQWDPDYMGSSMMVPVPFVLWMMGLAAFMFCTLLLTKAITERKLGRPLSFDSSCEVAHHAHAPLPTDESALEAYAGGGVDIELSGLPLKTYALHSGHAA